MSFLDHLDELRGASSTRCSRSLVGFLVAFAFIDRIFGFIMRPLQAVLPNGGTLVYTEPAEAFMLYMKVAALVGLIIAMPVVLYQVWSFVAPGLYTNEKRLAIPFVFFATALLRRGRACSPTTWSSRSRGSSSRSSRPTT